jgi:hypothetical protein
MKLYEYSVVCTKLCVCTVYFRKKLCVHCVFLYEVVCVLCISIQSVCTAFSFCTKLLCTAYFCTKLCVFCVFMYKAVCVQCILYETGWALGISVRQNTGSHNLYIVDVCRGAKVTSNLFLTACNFCVAVEYYTQVTSLKG